ncbi:MAG: hypothetical protein AAF741_18075 [Bacteroidota bacterium]
MLTYLLPVSWDSIQLASKQATHIYTTGSWLLPDIIDSGHPPGFGIYVSGWWTVFGRNLLVTHLSMIPINLLFFYQLIRVSERMGGSYWPYLFTLLMFEPLVLGQLCMISPDLAICGLLFMLLLAVMDKNHWLKLLAVLLLSVISTRAWMLVMGVFVIDLFANGKLDFWRKLWPYALGSLPAQVYLLTHYLAKGWIGYHENSPWIESLAIVEPSEMLFNVGLLGWRMIDYGRIYLWIAAGILLYRNRHSLRPFWQKYGFFILAFVVFVLSICVAVIPRHGIVGPRYLMPAILVFDLLFAALVFEYELLKKPFALKLRKSIWLGACLFLLSGSFWLYPFRIAQSWDATPLHVIHHENERKVIDWLDEKGIPLEQVGTVYPSIGPLDFRYVDGRHDGFVKYDGENPYLFVSMVHNAWRDEELDYIEEAYEEVAGWSRLGVFGRIYRKR